MVLVSAARDGDCGEAQGVAGEAQGVAGDAKGWAPQRAPSLLINLQLWKTSSGATTLTREAEKAADLTSMAGTRYGPASPLAQHRAHPGGHRLLWLGGGAGAVTSLMQ